LHEQETRLLDGTARGEARATAAGGDGRTRQASAQEAATVAQAPTRLSDDMIATAARLTAVAETASSAADSVVTRVAPLHSAAAPPIAAPPRRGLSGRVLGAVASVLLVVAVAGAYYAYTFRPSATTTATPPDAPQPVAESPSAESPASVPAPEAQQQSQQPSAPDPAARAAESEPVVVIKKSPDPAQKGGKRSGQALDDSEADAGAAGAPVVIAPDVNIPGVPVPEIPESELRGVDWTDPVARERAMRRVRRMVRQRQLDAERQRRQTEGQRRRRPTPDAPAPPPPRR
jgi:hypothetical protein